MKIVRLVIGRLAALSMAASLLLLGGCSSLKVTETWHATGKSGKQYHKLMVLGILNDENRRSMAENIVVDEFQRQGVGAVASHAYVKYLDNLTRDDVVAAVKAAGADALILVRPISIGDQKVTQEGQAGKVYGTLGSGPTYLPVAGFSTTQGASTILQATLQANLYDAATTELVWTATIKTFDADREARVSRDLGKFFLERLRLDGFL